MPKPLVIVESPAKAKTIAGYLGADYVVESSIGHIRDLPRSAADVPAAFKAEPWARLGVDVDNDFKPLYVVSREKREQVAKLRRLVAAASEVYLATDEDREGESIAWHLYEVLSPRVPVMRMVFHEITPAAIRAAIEHPRELDRRLVDAQEARRILDRLYGYEVSPVLWRKVAKGLSAGRVQSVATRIVVERERERMRFRSASWSSVEGSFSAEAQPFSAPGRDRGTPGGDRGGFRPDRYPLGSRDCRPSRRAGRERPRLRPRWRQVRRREPRGAPLPAFTGGPVHHLDAPAGGGSQAALFRPADDAGSPAPLRAGLHHLHADRLDDSVGHRREGRPGSGQGPLRGQLGPPVSSCVPQPGEERPGGPRGDPSGRGPLPHPVATRRGAQRRGAPTLRAGLAAHRRLADERRHRDQRPGPHRGAHLERMLDRPERGHDSVRGDRHGHHRSRLPRRVPGGRRRQRRGPRRASR